MHGSCVSSAPQFEHARTFSAASESALASGTISASLRFNNCNAARRAERGPKPGTFASKAISASISGAAVMDLERIAVRDVLPGFCYVVGDGQARCNHCAAKGASQNGAGSRRAQIVLLLDHGTEDLLTPEQWADGARLDSIPH